MGEMYLGSIFLWSLNWIPDDLAFCNGQTLKVADNAALFSLIGTTYGGDGQTTFALPDLRGRVPIGTTGGTRSGLTKVSLGDKGGSENAVVVAHNHIAAVSNTTVNLQGGFSVSNQPATRDTPPVGSSLAAMHTSDGAFPTPTTGPALGYNNLQPNTAILGLNASGVLANNGVVNVAQAGGSGTYANMQPFLGMNYVIVINGVYPSRP